MKITLKEFIDQCQEYTDEGLEVWIEGRGDGRWKLVIQEKEVKFGDEIGKTNS